MVQFISLMEITGQHSQYILLKIITHFRENCMSALLQYEADCTCQVFHDILSLGNLRLSVLDDSQEVPGEEDLVPDHHKG